MNQLCFFASLNPLKTNIHKAKSQSSMNLVVKCLKCFFMGLDFENQKDISNGSLYLPRAWFIFSCNRCYLYTQGIFTTLNFEYKKVP